MGDQVSARASVLVNSDAIDPATVRLSARFAPFGLVRTERAVHEDVGRAALVEVVYTLQCVTVDCLYAMERVVDGRTVSRPIRFPPGTLRARARDGSGAERASFRWPEVNLRSRLDESAIDLLETRPASFRRPDVSYAVSPRSRLGRDRRRGRAAHRRGVVRRERDPWPAPGTTFAYPGPSDRRRPRARPARACARSRRPPRRASGPRAAGPRAPPRRRAGALGDCDTPGVVEGRSAGRGVHRFAASFAEARNGR